MHVRWSWSAGFIVLTLAGCAFGPPDPVAPAQNPTIPDVLGVPVEIARQVIDHPDLQPFLHPEAPDRIPLTVSRTRMEEPLKHTKWGKAVRVVDTSALRGKPYLEFTDFRALGGLAVVAYEYRIEGVEGLMVFKESPDGHWAVVAHRVVEN